MALKSYPNLKGVNRYSLGEVLGSGRFGVVQKATDKKKKKVVAVKMVDLTKFGSADIRKFKENVKREIRLMRRCQHDNIVALLDNYDDGATKIYIVQEFCGGGNLLHFFASNEGGLGESTAQNFACQIACGLWYLHTRKPPIVHRDLKPENILLSEPTVEARLKIADFGEAQIKDKLDVNGLTAFHTVAGTKYYMAPEILAKNDVDDATTYGSSGMFATSLCSL